MQSKVSVSKLLEYIPTDLLGNLEEETKVNYQAKKLTGKVMLKLLLLTLLDSQKASLRVMEQIYCSQTFSIFSGITKSKIKHSGIAHRISSMNPVFFQKIFESLSNTFQGLLPASEKFSIWKTDSTLASLSAKLLRHSMHTGDKSKNQIKFTLGLKNSLPTDALVFTQPKELSEEIALKQSIFHSLYAKNSIVVFDRGLQKRKTFCQLTARNIQFITRLKSRLHYRVVRRVDNVEGRKTTTLTLKKDMIVYLQDEDSKWTTESFRLILTTSRITHEPLSFLTNIRDLGAEDITEIYKTRWEIEVFFKFLKQELHFSHLVSRTENGIKVMLYATLILALLLLVYKKLNQVASYKIAKIRFVQELDMEIVKEIILRCGGDPTRFFKPNIRYPT